MKTTNISKEKQEFSKWVMRQYFNPEKNHEAPWFCAQVNELNVSGKIKNKELTRFPYSYSEIFHMWKLVSSVRSTLMKRHADEEEKSRKEKSKYQTGEITLKDIGKQVGGGVTPTMVNNILNSATIKMKKITNGVSLKDLSQEQSFAIYKKICDSREQVGTKYTRELKLSNGNVEAFFAELGKKKIVSVSETRQADDNEKFGLKLLSEKEESTVKRILLEDIESDDNMFKTFQSAVSKHVFSKLN